MKHGTLSVAVLFLLAACPFIGNTEMTVPGGSQIDYITYERFAPEAVTNPVAAPQAGQTDNEKRLAQNTPSQAKAQKEVSAPVQKSTRKAFFLSLILPGLGEYYVGSKRSFLFLGVEAVAWYVYVTKTNQGNDLDSQFKSFADAHWHYDDTTSSTGENLVYDYWNWFKVKLQENGFSTNLSSTDYAAIDSLTQALVGKSGISHSLPATKTQQYYEMIGKYPQFVYGWEDITKNNAALRDSTGKANGNFDEDIRNILSPERTRYMDMRSQSNDKLKQGQYGVDLMILNRVVSAIDAARLAYHHNKKINSELSMVHISLVQKQIYDHKVPMLMLTKKF
jgi:hypothetical protein